MRPRLLAFLDQAHDARVTLLVAPAGFGKTSLLADHTARLDCPTVWLSLREWDRDAEAFADRLLAAFRPLLATPTSAPAASPHVERLAWARAIVERVASGLGDDPFALVLDDYQEIEAGETSRALVEALVIALPANARILIGSRVAPGLAVLPRLLAARQAVVLDLSLLKFTRDEVAELLLRRKGESAADDAEALWTLTGGWPAAVRIAVAAGWRGDEVGPDSPEALLGSLIEETLRRLTAEERGLLLKLSVFEEIFEELCASLRGVRFPDGLLSWLVDSGLPVSSSNDLTRPVYRLHPLLRGHLIRRLRLDPAAYQAAELDAGAACLAVGAELEALHHFTRSGAKRRVLALVPRVVSALLGSGRWATAVHLFDPMPAAWFDRHPELQIWHARALFWSGDSDAALDAVAQVLRSEADPATRAEALTLRAGALRKKGEYPAARAACYDALRLAEEHHLSPRVEFEARREFGFTLIMQGEFLPAREQLTACLTQFEVEQDRENAARARDGLGSIEGQLGNLPLAAVHLRHALAYWERLDNPAAACNTLNNLGMVHYMRGELEEARRAFDDALNAARRGGNRHIEGFTGCSLGDLDLDEGRLESAVRRYESALVIARELDSSTITAYALAGLGRTYLAQGAVERAEVRLAEAVEDARLRSGRSELARTLVWLARCHIAQGRLAEAEQGLREARELAEAGGQGEDAARARLWLAEIFYEQGLRIRALEEMSGVQALTAQFSALRTLERDLKLLPGLAALATSRVSAGTALGRALRLAGGGRTSDPVPEVAEVSLLGGFQVRIGGRILESSEWRTRRAKELFAYLVVHDPATKDEIMTSLWPDDSPEAANAGFRVTLHRLRNAILPLTVEFRDARYALHGYGSLWCDTLQFQKLVTHARELPRGAERMAALQQARELYKGALTPDLHEEWADEYRAALEAKHVATLSELAEHAASAGDYEAAARDYEAILAIESFNDSAALQLMFCRAAQGQRAAASHLFRTYTRRLREEGLEPSPSIVRFYNQLLTTT